MNEKCDIKWKMIYNEVYYTWSIVYRRIDIYIYTYVLLIFVVVRKGLDVYLSNLSITLMGDRRVNGEVSFAYYRYL